jgi:VanZ family protein
MDSYRLMLYIYTALVMVVCALPGGAFDAPDVVGMDKVIHLIMFLPIGFFARRSYRRRIPHGLTPRGQALLYCLCVGALSEAVQLFVPMRTLSFLDLSADVLGGIIGGFVSERILSRRSDEDRTFSL